MITLGIMLLVQCPTILKLGLLILFFLFQLILFSHYHAMHNNFFSHYEQLFNLHFFKLMHNLYQKCVAILIYNMTCQ